MSFCAASYSICCRPASCASATSDSLPTATALLCCRCACDCSADHRKTQLRQQHRPPIGPTHSGTAQAAVEPCASSNGSPPRNSCSALRLNQTDAPHETPSPSSAFARASAHTQIPCLIRPEPLAGQSLQLPHQPSPSHRTAPFRLQAIGPYPTQSVPDPSAPVQAHSKYIGFRGGGFLQVAVSEAPPLRACSCAMLRGGALQIQH